MNENNTQSDQVLQIMRAEYGRLDDSGEIAIRPAALAALTRAALDPDGLAPSLIEYCAILELRQMARTICRQKSPTEEVSASPQAELFDGQLQKRYPALRDEQEVYVLRERLTLKERKSIDARMSAAAISLSRHVDAFRAETRMLEMEGAFAEELEVA